jgi:Zn-dependent protease
MYDLADGMLWFLAFVFSTTLHEASHAWAALRLGDSTAYDGGQVTLDPIPHMRREPFGMLVVPLLSYFAGGWMMGWASAPYNLEWAQRYPKRSAYMALAGPMANLFLVVISAILIRAGLMLELFYPPDTIDHATLVLATQDGTATILAAFLNVFFSLNLVLFLFNLIPIPPLDGSSIIALFMSEERASRYLDMVRNPTFSLFGIFIAWNVFGSLYHPLRMVCVNLLYTGIQRYV